MINDKLSCVQYLKFSNIKNQSAYHVTTIPMHRLLANKVSSNSGDCITFECSMLN